MRKIVVVFIGLVLLLVACNSGTTETNKEEVSDTNLEEKAEEQAPDEEAETNGIESEEQEESSTNGDAIAQTETNGSNKQAKTNIPSNTKEQHEHQHLIDLANKIFDAQKVQDYSFLESIISKGTKIDQNSDTFYFENVTYPHEQPFLTKEDLGEIEFRYTHENNKDSIIVGFGIINYEDEFSYVVDFEFVNEDGTWKMNDMDINK